MEAFDFLQVFDVQIIPMSWGKILQLIQRTFGKKSLEKNLRTFGEIGTLIYDDVQTFDDFFSNDKDDEKHRRRRSRLAFF